MADSRDISQLERWELYRTEMLDSQRRLAKIAADFLGLGAFEDAAKVAMRCEAIKHFIGRMPQAPAPQADQGGDGPGKG